MPVKCVRRSNLVCACIFRSKGYNNASISNRFCFCPMQNLAFHFVRLQCWCMQSVGSIRSSQSDEMQYDTQSMIIATNIFIFSCMENVFQIKWSNEIISKGKSSIQNHQSRLQSEPVKPIPSSKRHRIIFRNLISKCKNGWIVLLFFLGRCFWSETREAHELISKIGLHLRVTIIWYQNTVFFLYLPDHVR